VKATVPFHYARLAEPEPRHPVPWEKGNRGGGGPGDPSAPSSDGPRRPDVKVPDTKSLLERMRRVDREQARRYRQRTGQWFSVRMGRSFSAGGRDWNLRLR